MRTKHVFGIGWVILQSRCRSIGVFSNASFHEMIYVVGNCPVRNCFISLPNSVRASELGKTVVTYVWLSGRQTSKPREANVVFRLLNNQLLAANPPTRKMDCISCKMEWSSNLRTYRNFCRCPFALMFDHPDNSCNRWFKELGNISSTKCRQLHSETEIKNSSITLVASTGPTWCLAQALYLSTPQTWWIELRLGWQISTWSSCRIFLWW